MKEIDIAKENGFDSVETMKKYHKPIVDIACNFSGNIFDLGCGNGYLLKEIEDMNSEAIPFGIDSNRKAIENAKKIQPKFSNNFFAGDMFDTPDILSDDIEFELVILMPVRFLDGSYNHIKRVRLLNWIKIHSKNILTYIYEDKLKMYGDIENVLNLTGFEIIKRESNMIALVRVKDANEKSSLD